MSETAVYCDFADDFPRSSFIRIEHTRRRILGVEGWSFWVNPRSCRCVVCPSFCSERQTEWNVFAFLPPVEPTFCCRKRPYFLWHNNGPVTRRGASFLHTSLKHCFTGFFSCRSTIILLSVQFETHIRLARCSSFAGARYGFSRVCSHVCRNVCESGPAVLCK